MISRISTHYVKDCIRLVAILFLSIDLHAQTPQGRLREYPAGEGWARNSVNTVIFRKNSLVTHEGVQYIAYYNGDGCLVLGKRTHGSSEWEIRETQYRGNTADAHNTISIMTDGDGYLHVSWDHHNNALRYARSLQPGSLELSGKMPMTGVREGSVSYPEFYRMPNGDLLFFYRDGGSGRGDLVVNKYDLKTKSWKRLHDNLISGEGVRNAYWQACVDGKGAIHVSWVWRETPDVASNHDLCYARSTDGGETWEKSTGEKYDLPITAANAEYARLIPQNSELINQTSMTASDDGMPYIAAYWRDPDSDVPQYRVVYLAKKGWRTLDLNFRTTPFSLIGVGTKRIPVSRPQILVDGAGKKVSALLVFRDEERGEKISVAKIKNVAKGKWELFDLSSESYGSWEPTYDTELWRQKKVLSLFAQRVVQIDREGSADIPPQPVKAIEWEFRK